jgi:hypothetical protein
MSMARRSPVSHFGCGLKISSEINREKQREEEDETAFENDSRARHGIVHDGVRRDGDARGGEPD